MNARTESCALGLLAVALLVTACSREPRQNQTVTTTTNTSISTAPPAREVEKRDTALVRFVHAIANGASVDVFADDRSAFTNIAYKTVTPYREMTGTRFTFSVLPAGQHRLPPRAEKSENLAGGRHYTLITLSRDPAGKEVTLQIIGDDLVPPPAGKAKLRVIHASPDAGELDVYAKGKRDALFSGMSFEKKTGYLEVDPMTATLEVRPTGENNAVLAVPNAKIEAGKIYTIIIVGLTQGTPKLEAIVVEDRLGGEMVAPGKNGQSPAITKKKGEPPSLVPNAY